MWILTIFSLLLSFKSAEAVAPKNMVKIEKGAVTPFFDKSKDGKRQKELVPTFYLDIYQVTNSDYLDFVKKNPAWQKSKVAKIFADSGYLSHWSNDFSFDKSLNESPVRYVSWFAASKYCQFYKKELPTVAQWEYAAAADEKSKDATNGEAFRRRILDWYSKPTGENLPNVREAYRNAWGVYGMHGVVWEWTLDFNTALVTGESREDSTINKDRFCGSGVLGAKDSRDYSAFMRYGFRSSLRGDYTVKNLGFRCAKKTGD